MTLNDSAAALVRARRRLAAAAAMTTPPIRRALTFFERLLSGFRILRSRQLPLLFRCFRVAALALGAFH